MEGFMFIVYLIMVVWGILNIILFFKIWGMTNDVRELKEKIVEDNSNINIQNDDVIQSNKSENVNDTNSSLSNKGNDLKVGDKIQHESYYKDKDLYVGKINADGTCLCVNDKGEAVCTLSINKLHKI